MRDFVYNQGMKSRVLIPCMFITSVGEKQSPNSDGLTDTIPVITVSRFIDRVNENTHHAG